MTLRICKLSTNDATGIFDPAETSRGFKIRAAICVFMLYSITNYESGGQRIRRANTGDIQVGIRQSGEGNYANVLQGDAMLSAHIEQAGHGNVAEVEQF